MNISDIPFSTLSLEAICDLAVKFHRIVQQNHPDNPLLTAALENLQAAIDKAMAAIGKNRKKELTEDVHDADTLRGRLFISLRKHIEADQYYDLDAGIKDSADLLSEIIRKHGNQLNREPMGAQSTLLASLVRDMEATDGQTALTILQLNERLNDLKQAQDAFMQLEQKRDELEVSKDTATRQEAQTELVDSLSSLLKGLDFLYSVEPATYKKTVELISEMTAQTITNERKRQANARTAASETDNNTEAGSESESPVSDEADAGEGTSEI